MKLKQMEIVIAVQKCIILFIKKTRLSSLNKEMVYKYIYNNKNDYLEYCYNNNIKDYLKIED